MQAKSFSTQRIKRYLCTLGLIAFLVTGCGRVTEPVIAEPSRNLQTSGGGLTSSTNYASQIRIGSPQPMGQVKSENFNATMGPGSPKPPSRP